MKVAVGTAVTAFVGSLYEVNPASGVTTTYYYAGSSRVAMRTAAGVTWLQGDHLGSASLATNAAGAKVSDERYLPYGATRSGGVPTAYQFTGQRLDTGTGLYYYGARYYDPVVGRFISADTIVPGAGSPQALNRYAYVYNNPLRYTDPTGHRVECGSYEGECNGDTYYAGYSVLDQRPEVQAYLSEAMDSSHFLDPIVNWLAAGLLGAFTQETLGVFLPVGWQLGAPSVRTGRSQSPFRARDAYGEPGPAPDQFRRLPARIEAAFANSEYQGMVLHDDLDVFRAEGNTFGHWFGSVRPDSAAAAESMYNVAGYGNNLVEVSAYRIPALTVVYEGPVAGGTGWQYYVAHPRTVGVQLLASEPLPQWGF